MSTKQQALIPQNVELAAPTPMSVLQLAVQQGATVETLRGLMELQERWEAGEARKAFVEAMTAFKADPPDLYKNKHVKYGNTEYDHATLDNAVDTITPALSKYGLSHSWKVEQSGGTIKVTCVLTHKQGHSESVTVESGPDKSGSKNDIQAISSAISYLERYSFLAAVGMAAKDADNDGMTAGLSNLNEHLEWIANAKDLPELKKLYQNAYAAANEAQDSRAQKAIIEAKNARYKVLAG